MNAPRLSRQQIALRASMDLESGWYVNLGIGIPNLVADVVTSRTDLVLHSENGILGLGPEPSPDDAHPDLIDSGKRFASVRAGSAFFDSATSFAMIRGGHIDAAIVGGYQVSAAGDLANWSIPDERVPGIGGAADICAGVPHVFVAMTHVFRNGEPKIVPKCTYPITGWGVVRRIYTDLAVIEVTDGGLRLLEVVDGHTADYVQGKTDAKLEWDSDLATIPLEPEGQGE